MLLQKYISKALNFLTGILLILFFASAGFMDNRTTGWYQQWFPNLNGSTITSLNFLDSLIGFATTTKNTLNQTYVLKTTNGGDNWNIIFNYIPAGVNTRFQKVCFANYNIGYVSTNDDGAFFKTTNGGLNWINYPVPLVAYDFSVINADTLLHVNNVGLGSGVYRSTNGGLSWQGISSVLMPNIYMFNKNVGFSMGNVMRKTTNGGFNWITIPNEDYTSIKFADSLTGWKCSDSIKKTTNGGLNWFSQRTPNLPPYFSLYTGLSNLNNDTVWMVGAEYIYPLIFLTTNGGINWGYQIPSTALQISGFSFVQFVNKKIGWVYFNNRTFEMHTVIGGNDTTFFTGVNNNISSLPDDYILYQNYPNPFNQSSIIDYQCSISSQVQIRIFNIIGSEIAALVNEEKPAGKYSIRFDGSNLPSGVYFYTLFADGVRIDTKKMLLIK